MNVSGIHERWFGRADTDLRCADILFKNGQYACAIFHLQQADEKIAKGILNGFGFMAGDPTATQLFELIGPRGEKIFRDILEMNKYSPKGYGHSWHERMLDFMEVVVTWLSSWNKYLQQEGSSREFTYDASRESRVLLDFRQKIDAARRIEPKLDISVQELDQVTSWCRGVLDPLEEADNLSLEVSKMVQLPPKGPIIAALEKQLGIKMDENTLKKIDALYSGPVISDLIAKTMVLSEILIVLTILNIYLVSHEVYSRYPDPEVGLVYDENLPLVRRYDQVRALLLRCLELARPLVPLTRADGP